MFIQVYNVKKSEFCLQNLKAYLSQILLNKVLLKLDMPFCDQKTNLLLY